MGKKTRICSISVMDEISDPDIKFNDKGECHYLEEINEKLNKLVISNVNGKKNIIKLKKKIKKNKKNKYDCVVGVSGGVDSSYVAFLAWKLKLNALLVHFDNGWNSSEAIENINKIIDTTGFDLKTFVVDWPEFRDIQRSFFKASVVDVELVTDHCLFSVCFKIAKENKIHFILSGSNDATENFMPKSWIWYKRDVKNIKSIHKKFGSLEIKKFPYMSNFQYNWLKNNPFFKINYIRILDLFRYKKYEAIKELKNYFNWVNYGNKHFESFFTKFYQSYYLPKKFRIDKRKVHLTSLILNGEISRNQALLELNSGPFDVNTINNDIVYICKKLGFTKLEFEKIMKNKRNEHYDFDNMIKVRIYLKKFGIIRFIYNLLKKY